MRSDYRPQVEQLGERVLPSATPLNLPTAVLTSAQVVQFQQFVFGKGSGTYTGASLVVDAGVSYSLHGAADITGLGHVTVSGSVHGVGMIVKGHAGGTLTFTNAHGSVTIELTGPEQRGFASLPLNYSYKVTQGSGDYKNLQYHGTLQLAFVAATTPTTKLPILTFPTSHGTFSLTMPFSLGGWHGASL
jgi:hypothetical protein